MSPCFSSPNKFTITKITVVEVALPHQPQVIEVEKVTYKLVERFILNTPPHHNSLMVQTTNFYDKDDVYVTANLVESGFFWPDITYDQGRVQIGSLYGHGADLDVHVYIKCDPLGHHKIKKKGKVTLPDGYGRYMHGSHR